MTVAALARDLLDRLDVSEETDPHGEELAVRSPIDGSILRELRCTTEAALQQSIDRAAARFLSWREVPAPRRGLLIRELGALCRKHKDILAQLITLETGKILSEGRGEVQEAIDICEFAVGLSRQLHGLSIASERPSHKLFETWHPMGLIAVITAFNFPIAVWAWNAALALVCTRRYRHLEAIGENAAHCTLAMGKLFAPGGAPSRL